MNTLLSASSELLAHHQKMVDEHSELANLRGVRPFSDLLRKDLQRVFGSAEAAHLVEATTRFCGFNELERIRSMDRAVSLVLRQKGLAIPKGKRASRGLVQLVETLTPILVSLGIAPATGEGSTLVKVLREIADELDIPGDPRDVLRSAQRRGKRLSDATMRDFFEAFAKGVAPDSD